MAWRVPAFVALGDLDAARREVAGAAGDRRADGAAVHAPRRRALRLGDRARATGASRRPRRGRERSHEWSRLLTGRDAVGRLRDPDVQRPPRAGAAGGARAGDPDPGGRRRAAAARGGPGSSRCSPSSAWRPRRGASSRGSSPEGLDPFRESLWLASLTYLTDACAALGDERSPALVYPELEPLAGGT